MSFPVTRLRRLRSSPQIRSLVRETRLHLSDFIMPMFLVPGNGVKKEIVSLPGQFHLSVDECVEQAKRMRDQGIQATLLFGIPEHKDETGSSASQPDGIIQRASEAIKREVSNLLVVADLCFCEYTSHGHCGVVRNKDVDNDMTLALLKEQALSLARSGVDMIAPSGMMDGVVHAVRSSLDEHSFSNISIMSYSAKYASAFFGPFREAVNSTPSFGDRRSYQMDPGNAREALREVALDIEEGADIVMVKPALPYLDVLHAVKTKFQMPTAAYNVSGEYAMVKAAAEKGWIGGNRVMLELLTAIKRAGADIIISYFAQDFAALYHKGLTDPA